MEHFIALNHFIDGHLLSRRQEGTAENWCETLRRFLSRLLWAAGADLSFFRPVAPRPAFDNSGFVSQQLTSNSVSLQPSAGQRTAAAAETRDYRQ